MAPTDVDGNSGLEWFCGIGNWFEVKKKDRKKDANESENDKSVIVLEGKKPRLICKQKQGR